MTRQSDTEMLNSGCSLGYQELEERITQLEKELKEKDKMVNVYREILNRDSEIYNLTRAMIDNVPEMIWAKDKEDRYIFANQSFSDNFLNCNSPLDAEGHKDNYFAEKEREKGLVNTFAELCGYSDESVKKSGKQELFEESGKARGRDIVLKVIKSPIFNKSGEIVGTVGYGQDITHTRKVEVVLKNTSRIFRDVANDVESVAIHGYNKERRVTMWNHASEVLYGYTRKEAMGRKLEDLIVPEEMREKLIQLHRRWFETGKKIPSGQVVLQNKEGKAVHVYSSYILTETHLGREMFCIDLDLSPLRKAEEERRTLREQLLQVQKMEAVGTLAGGIAHDFNNILTIILGSADLARHHKDIPPEIDEYMGQIVSAGNRAKKLVNQILTFSRQKEVDRIPIKPGVIVDEVLKLLRSSLPGAIGMEQEIDMSCGPILMDPTQLHQLCMNLCTNALHAMEETGGTLSVSLQREKVMTKAQLGVVGGEPADYVVITFRDTGIGISPSIKDKIFNPYFTTKEASRGTGMGLAIVHGIVKSYNGFIDCESEPGQGASFKVHFPVIPGSEDTEPEEFVTKKQKQQIVRGSERILLVDDEPKLAKVQKNVLQMLGYKVSYHKRSKEALKAFKEQPDGFDLVISSQAMPEMTGLEIATEMMEIRPTLAVIILTGHSNGDVDEIAKQSGIKAVARKPITIKNLAILAREVLT